MLATTAAPRGIWVWPRLGNVEIGLLATVLLVLVVVAWPLEPDETDTKGFPPLGEDADAIVTTTIPPAAAPELPLAEATLAIGVFDVRRDIVGADEEGVTEVWGIELGGVTDILDDGAVRTAEAVGNEKTFDGCAAWLLLRWDVLCFPSIASGLMLIKGPSYYSLGKINIKFQLSNIKINIVFKY